MFSPQKYALVHIELSQPFGHIKCIGSLNTCIIPRIGERIFIDIEAMMSEDPDHEDNEWSTDMKKLEGNFRVVDIEYRYDTFEINTWVDAATKIPVVTVLVCAE